MAVVRAPLCFLLFVLVILYPLAIAFHLPHENPQGPAAHRGKFSNIARRSVTLDLKRNPNYNPNGPAEYARALRKWGAEVPQQLVHSLAAMGDPGGKTGEVDAESIKNDREYLSRVGFGTPLQWLNMDLDTGSADVWVYSTETQPEVAKYHTLWKMEESSTAKKVENGSWMITYGDGSAAWGNIYHDTVSLASITIPNATVESALSAAPPLAGDPDLDGIFGLSYGLPSLTTPPQQTLLSALLPHLESPLFTVDLHHHSSHKPSSYTFGTIPASHHTGHAPLHYTRLIPQAQYWQFAYRGIHVEGQEEWYINPLFNAIADTGTTLMLLSRPTAELYYGSVPGAWRNYTLGGIWTFPCSGYKLPDFEIGLVADIGGVEEAVIAVPGRYMNYSAFTDGTGTCMGGLQEWGYDEFGIFGDVFLKAVYAVFDVGAARIGFAQKVLEPEV
ncbi:aspartic peptidase domain-containing protein [Staphylotrichum tortipilum]|uniref:Aspartic peptidase domain-containing protein n=1 Tax=Staphylotrichum tortipilum TaxID=2831512 RepID=A0AAN6MF05_9PEZI|nr:aspartic peptidase domain-containing protein [Staphylotrichum longicolle]